MLYSNPQNAKASGIDKRF